MNKFSNQTITYRNELNGDQPHISGVITAAFAEHPYSDHKEQDIVQRLREDEQLSVSIVATCTNTDLDDENNTSIVGHISFSKITIDGEDKQYYGLAPVSVLPAYQQQGIGAKLIELGLEQIKQLGANGCVLVGEPEYYQRFGFVHDAAVTYSGLPAEFLWCYIFVREM